jgi:hypothetical protein
MTPRRGRWLSEAVVLLAVAGLAGTLPLHTSAGPDGFDAPEPAIAASEPGTLAVPVGPALPEPARLAGPERRLGTPEGVRRDGVPADHRVAFLRAHVARRMQRFADHDPEQAADAILVAAQRARIDPVLLLAIIEVESAFDPLARSERNALGLMQVRPATLWREAERSGLEGDDPHDPELNILAGALYFRRLVDAFGLNDIALMAYNAGPNRILPFVRAGEEIPERYREYPRRVRATEARLRRALAVDSAGTALARSKTVLANARLE